MSWKELSNDQTLEDMKTKA